MASEQNAKISHDASDNSQTQVEHLDHSNGKSEFNGEDKTKAHIENAEHFVLGYGQERGTPEANNVVAEDNPWVHETFDAGLAVAFTAMSFLWIGSQIPLYLFGSVLPLIYTDIGGYEIYVWCVIGYLIPNAALCPFVGALSDMYGRKAVGAAGQLFLIVGPIVTTTANDMLTVIGGMVLSGVGAGLNELIALAGTAELVPVRKRGTYVGLLVFTILPFCPSALWAQLIAKESSWRFVGILVIVWNFIGLILLVFFYKDPARNFASRKKSDILKEVDYIGGFLSTAGVLFFMMGMQWGAEAYPWDDAHVLGPFIVGLALIVAFFVWEMKFAPHPMVPPAMFSKAKRTMSLILLITFLSGANYFVLLLFWPTQVFNVYGYQPVQIGIRTLPIGFGIIGGAAIVLMLIPILNGRTTVLMIVNIAIMTAGTGAMSISTPHNLGATYAVITIASLGVGAVIIPCSIIAQIACPTELIGTITAITLAIRYIGGAIGFTAYYNVLFRKFTTYSADIVGYAIVANGIAAPDDIETITALITLAGQSFFDDLRTLIETSPKVGQKAIAYDTVVAATQEAYALAYRWPYWISIAFGGACLILSLFLKDIRHLM